MPLYSHVGLALARSPRMGALMAEAALHAPHLGERLSLVHAGPRTAAAETAFQGALREANLPDDTPIHWSEGGSPDEALLRAIRQHDIDLLIAGALEKERSFRYYLGSVARTLAREASCSLLLLARPQATPQPFRRIVVVTDYSEGAAVALARAQRLAAREEAEKIYVLRVLSPYGEALHLTEGVSRQERQSYQEHNRSEEERLLRDVVDAAGHSSITVEPMLLEGHPGRTTCRFTRQYQADLLVMPSNAGYHHIFERLFPSQMEWVLREIPCNLWVVREQFTTA